MFKANHFVFIICRSATFRESIFKICIHIISINTLLTNLDECPIKNVFLFDVLNTFSKFNSSLIFLALRHYHTVEFGCHFHICHCILCLHQ